jgi:hypothetical protein
MLTPSLPSRVTPRKVCEEEVCWSSNPRNTDTPAPPLPSHVAPRKVGEEEVCWSSNPRKLAAFQAKERRRGMGL